MANVAVHVTAPPQFTPVYGGGVPLGNGFNKRQDLTFFSCGFECFPGDFCQGYRSSYGVCCGTSVLSRSEYNFCAPATGCVEYSVSSFATYSYDSTRSVQYCGSALPYCATYIWTDDSFTNIFCADTASGVYTFDTTSSGAGPSATFIGRTSSSRDESTTSEASTSNPSATVISNTRTLSTPSETPTETGGGGAPNPNNDNQSSGLSTGATAGIAVGAAVGGIGLALAAFFLWRKRSKKTTPEGTNNQFPPQPPMSGQNTGYQPNNQYPPQPPFSPGPTPATPAGGEYYNKYPAQPPVSNQPVYYELGGGDAQTPLMAQLPDGNAPQKGIQSAPYQENVAPHSGGNRQELQG